MNGSVDAMMVVIRHGCQHLLHREVLQDMDRLESVTWFGQLMAKPQLIAYLIQLDYWFRHYRVEMV